MEHIWHGIDCSGAAIFCAVGLVCLMATTNISVIRSLVRVTYTIRISLDGRHYAYRNL